MNEKLTQKQYDDCIQILRQELKPATGCSEPIAIAYCSSLAHEALGQLPDRILVEASGNIVKNVKSVVVPNTNGLKGISAAVAVGIVAGNPRKELEVISLVTPPQRIAVQSLLDTTPIEIRLLESEDLFDLIVTLYHGDSYAKARISQFHTNVIFVERDGNIEHYSPISSGTPQLIDRNFLNVELIYDFANHVKIEDVRDLIKEQISCNMKIAKEGLCGDYGANIGKVLLTSYPMNQLNKSEQDIKILALAHAAAGSDARMDGCELPVIINSGSGNQGITCSIPIIVYARELNIDDDQLYRSLVFSSLLCNHLKTPIGRLSAYCGAVSAGAAASCGIAYLKQNSFDVIKHTLVNTLALSSGIVCDGAKASCAGKIVMALQAGFLGYEMYQQGQEFLCGDGIITERNVESVIYNVGRLGREGMKQTDIEILRIMTGC